MAARQTRGRMLDTREHYTVTLRFCKAMNLWFVEEADGCLRTPTADDYAAITIGDPLTEDEITELLSDHDY